MTQTPVQSTGPSNVAQHSSLKLLLGNQFSFISLSYLHIGLFDAYLKVGNLFVFRSLANVLNSLHVLSLFAELAS